MTVAALQCAGSADQRTGPKTRLRSAKHSSMPSSRFQQTLDQPVANMTIVMEGRCINSDGKWLREKVTRQHLSIANTNTIIVEF